MVLALVILSLLSLAHFSPALAARNSTAWALLVSLILLALTMNRLPLQWIVLLFVAAIPIDPDGAIGFLPKLSALDYFSAAAFFTVVSRNFKSFFLKAWRVFPIISALCWVLFFLYAIVSVKLLHGEFRGTLRWGEFLFCYVLVCLAIDEEPDHAFSFSTHVAKFLSVTTAVISLLAIIQFSRADGNASSAHATFGQRNVMAAFLSLCLPACSAIIPGISPQWILLRKVASFLGLCAFILSYSRGAWIGLAFGILLIVWGLRHSRNFHLGKLKEAMFVILLIIGPLAGLLIIRNPQRPIFSFSGRPLYWQATWNVLEKHPWTGLGPGNYYKHLPDYLTNESLRIWHDDLIYKHDVDFWQHLHSLYFQILVEYGMIGFMLWAGGLGTIIYRAMRRTLAETELIHPFFMISIVAYLTHNLVDMLTVHSLDLLFVIFLAINSHPLKRSSTQNNSF